MKKLLIAFALIFATIPAFSQTGEQETLFGNEELRNGGYGAPEVKFTKIHDDFGVMVGGRGGWIINSTFSIGGGGYALTTSPKVYDINDTSYYLRMGYGGAFIEYINSSNSLVHFTVNALIGAGGATNTHSINHMIKNGNYDVTYNWNDDQTTFFIFEPGVTVDVNLLKFMRLSIGGSYRLVSGVELKGVTNQDISGPSGSIGIKFGKF
jgi:hypothetical protein